MDEPFVREARTVWKYIMKVLFSPRFYEIAAVYVVIGGVINTVKTFIDLAWQFTGEFQAPISTGLLFELFRVSTFTVFNMGWMFTALGVCVGLSIYLRNNPRN